MQSKPEAERSRVVKSTSSSSSERVESDVTDSSGVSEGVPMARFKKFSSNCGILSVDTVTVAVGVIEVARLRPSGLLGRMSRLRSCPVDADGIRRNVLHGRRGGK